MRLLVIGGGAIGGPLAARLSTPPHEVLLVEGWSAHLNAIRERGLEVETVGVRRLFPIDVVSPQQAAALDWRPDIAFISVKAYDTELALDLLDLLLPAEATVVSTQNGFNEEKIAQRLGDQRVIGAVTEVGGYMRGPGQVVETRPDGGFVIGELDGSATERCRSVAEVLSLAAPTSISANIKGLMWSKLLWNCTINPLTALTGMGQGRLLHWPPGRRLALAVADEVASVAAQLDVVLEPLDFLGIDPRELVSSGSIRARAEQKLLERYSTQMDKSTSMSQDIANGRRTEIDALNGFVVERARALGMATPLNARLVVMIHDLETGHLTPDPAVVESMQNAVARGRESQP